jgi:hypothetical protein
MCLLPPQAVTRGWHRAAREPSASPADRKPDFEAFARHGRAWAYGLTHTSRIRSNMRGGKSTLVRLEQATQEHLDRHVERIEQSNQRGEPNLALAALDPGYLYGGEAGSGGEVLLGPSALVSCAADVLAELLDRVVHVCIFVAQNQTGHDQSGKMPREQQIKVPPRCANSRGRGKGG